MLHSKCKKKRAMINLNRNCMTHYFAQYFVSMVVGNIALQFRMCTATMLYKWNYMHIILYVYIKQEALCSCRCTKQY